jgi:hypothetical protein
MPEQVDIKKPRALKPKKVFLAKETDCRLILYICTRQPTYREVCSKALFEFMNQS